MVCKNDEVRKYKNFHKATAKPKTSNPGKSSALNTKKSASSALTENAENTFNN